MKWRTHWCKNTGNQKGNTISLQLRVSVTFAIHILFVYSMLSVIDELCMHSFHYILLIIILDQGVVLFMDPLRIETEKWEDLAEMLQR